MVSKYQNNTIIRFKMAVIHLDFRNVLETLRKIPAYNGYKEINTVFFNQIGLQTTEISMTKIAETWIKWKNSCFILVTNKRHKDAKTKSDLRLI